MESAVERVVVARRLERLEVLGQRAVDHAVALQASVLLPQHEEGLVVRRDRLVTLDGNEVGLVDQDPLLAVPFHELLVLVPRLALHVAAVAVVQDAAVARPAERPLGVQADAGLVLGVAAAQRLLCRVERSVVVVPHTGVDPHRACGGTVGAQLGVVPGWY